MKVKTVRRYVSEREDSHGNVMRLKWSVDRNDVPESLDRVATLLESEARVKRAQATGLRLRLRELGGQDGVHA